MDFPYGRTWLLDGADNHNLLPADFNFSYPLSCLSDSQNAFLAAGADTLCIPALTVDGVPERERAEQAENLQRLLSMTKQIAGQRPVGGRLEPFGRHTDLEEDPSFSERIKFYTEQALHLKVAGADYLMIEGMDSLTDTRAAVLACRRQKLPILVCVTVDEEGLTASDTTALTCLVVLQELGISAFGLGGTLTPAQMAPLFEELSAFAKIPLLAKPAAFIPASQNSRGISLTPDEFACEFTQLFERGVTLAGGGQGVTPECLAALRKTLDTFPFSTVKTTKNSRELVLTSVHETFCYDLDMVEFSPTLHPAGDMTDEFMEIEDDSFDIISVEVETPDEAAAFAENDHMAKLPVSFLSSSELALKTALLLYSGRAMVDARSEIEQDVLERIAHKYGAVVY